jgi:hypothetical protein
MFRLSVITFALVPLATVTPAAPVPKDAGKTVLYFPTSVGAKWVYKSGKTEWVEQVTAVEEKDGAWVVTIGDVVGDKVTPSYKRLVSPNGLFTGPGGLKEVRFALTLLKLPAKPRDEWEWARDKGGAMICTVVGTEVVEVPAGKFRAVRVESTLRNGEDTEPVQTGWFAPGVGQVKLVLWGGDGELSTVLKSFTPGKE